VSGGPRVLDHSDRDAIRERAGEDLLGVYDALGGHRRGRALHCISPSHQDRSPSASIRRDRYRCFGCGLSVDAIGLVMHVLGLDYLSALRWLGERYGVPVGQRRPTSAQRRRYAVAKAEAAALAIRLADFARGLEITLGRTVTTLSGWLMTQGIDPSEGLAHLHYQLRVLRTAKPRDLEAVWRAMPAEAVVLERVGREDREHAEAITKAVIEVLACAQEAPIVGAPIGSREAA